MEEDKETDTSFVCPNGCGKSFGSSQALGYHVNRLVCVARDLEPVDAATLVKDTPVEAAEAPASKKKKSTKTGTRPCPLGCGKMLGTSQAIKYHVEKKVCVRPTEGELDADGKPRVARRMESTDFQCTIGCGKYYGTPQALKYHLENRVCERLPKDAAKKKRVVEKNGEESVKKPMTKKASDADAPKVSLTCPENCGKEFGSAYALKYHVDNRVCSKGKNPEDSEDSSDGKRKKTEKKTEDKKNATIPCTLGCGKMFGSPQALKYHVEKKVCDKKEDLQEKSPDAIGNLKCQLCDKDFGSPAALKYHTENKVCERNKNPMLNVSALIPAHAAKKAAGRKKYNSDRFTSDPYIFQIHTDTPQIQSKFDKWDLTPSADGIPISGFTDSTFAFGDINDSGHSTPRIIAGMTSFVDNDRIFINSGRPVTCSSFCPSPLGDVSLLGVGTGSKNYSIMGRYEDRLEDAYIEVWRVNTNSHGIDYCVRIPNAGTVLDISWCPSDGLRTETRAGLLAAVTSSGDLYVFSMPVVGSPVMFDASEICVAKTKASACCIEWSPSAPCNLLAAGMLDGSVRVWDLQHAMKVHNLDSFSTLHFPFDVRGYTMCNSIDASSLYAIRSLCWCQDDPNLIATVGHDNFARIWDRMQEKPTLEAPTGNRCSKISWPLKADYLILADDSGKVHFLDILSGKFTGYPQHDGPINDLKVCTHFESPVLAASVGSDGNAITWVCRPFLSKMIMNGCLCLPPSGLRSNASYVKYTSAAVIAKTSLVDGHLVVRDGPGLIAGYDDELRSEVKQSGILHPTCSMLKTVAWGVCSEMEEDGKHRHMWIAVGGASGIIRCQVVRVNV